MVKSRSLKLAVIVTVVVMLAAGGVWAQRTRKPGAAGLMGSIPSESLLCVRINKLDESLGAVNAYLGGIAPESFDAKAMVFSKLGKLLGDAKLRGVNRNGNAALFAVIVPGESAGQNPMGNMFMGALLPVRNYDNFISRNPNCGQPDDAGISTITVDGRLEGLATRFRRYALLCPPHLREKLPQVTKMMAQRKRSLVSRLDDNEKKLAATSSIWLSVNVKQGAPLIKPMVFGKLEQIKGELQKAKESGEAPMMIDPSGAIDFYGGIFKMLIEGTDRIAVGLSPNSETCNLTYCLKPIPGTEMETIVGQELGGNLDHMLGYLGDETMMNIASKVDRPSLTAGYMKLFELMGQMIPGGLPEADLEELKALTTRGIEALGDTLAVSVGINPEGSPSFWAKYVFEVKDEEAFEQIIEKEIEMMEEGVFDKLYKSFGMEMDVNIERDAGTYKGATIAAAKVKFKTSEEAPSQPTAIGSLQGKALESIFGDGLDYRWAFVKGHCVYTVGADANGKIRELIDQVRAGGPKGISSEMKTAMGALDNSSEADAVGTFNYVRMLNIALGFMLPASDTDAPKINTTSKSNIAFAGRTTDGIMTFQMVLPKRHLQEIKSAFETIIPEIEKQQRQQK